jgi:hypothetical protein
MDEDNTEYYENINYRELLKLQPEGFYLHLPFQIPFTKWFFEARLQALLMIGWDTNYFGLRHLLQPQAQWFSDWVFVNHYIYDYKIDKKWKPSLVDRLRYYWFMIQGYGKENKHYLELNARNNDHNVTVKERKFLDHYSKCHYHSYFDAERADELAMFRTGLDADQPLANEDKPLFPNIAYSYKDDPRLAYFVAGNMRTEYIPKYNSWVVKKLARISISRKWSKNQKVTYADMRVMFNPDTTKIHDLEFLIHCFDKHGGSPEDIEENKLYEKLYPLYSLEIMHIAQSMHIPVLDKLNIAQSRRHLNPLYVAYKKRWIGINPIKDFEKTFHGVTKAQYQQIVNKQYKYYETPKRKKTNKVSKAHEIDKLFSLAPPTINHGK